MLFAWCFAVSYLTFGSGPGTSLGNIYFATWIGFFVALNLVTTSGRHAYEEHFTGRGGKSPKEAAAAAETGETGAQPPTAPLTSKIAGDEEKADKTPNLPLAPATEEEKDAVKD